jgi:Ser/Thr protein kinase RdoA (MazF antagonist)
VKEVGDTREGEVAEMLDGARFQDAASAAGVPVPPVRRALDGEVIADLGDTRARMCGWVDMDPPDLLVDPSAIGNLVAQLHRVPFEGSIGVDPWYADPVGEVAWRSTVAALNAARAPFAEELDALLPEVLALETLLGEPPTAMRTCHRDLWADNVRRTHGGGLCVFDFDNAGLADPSWELAAVLVEYAGWDLDRSRELRAAYADAGGPGRVAARRDFTMVIAQLHHIVAEGCRRWLAATSDEQRADNEGWVREFIERPVTRSLVEALLDA